MGIKVIRQAIDVFNDQQWQYRSYAASLGNDIKRDSLGIKRRESIRPYSTCPWSTMKDFKVEEEGSRNPVTRPVRSFLGGPVLGKGRRHFLDARFQAAP